MAPASVGAERMGLKVLQKRASDLLLFSASETQRLPVQSRPVRSVREERNYPGRRWSRARVMHSNQQEGLRWRGYRPRPEAVNRPQRSAPDPALAFANDCRRDPKSNAGIEKYR